MTCYIMTQLEKVIQAGCNDNDVFCEANNIFDINFNCIYPKCACKAIPGEIKAAINALINDPDTPEVVRQWLRTMLESK